MLDVWPAWQARANASPEPVAPARTPGKSTLVEPVARNSATATGPGKSTLASQLPAVSSPPGRTIELFVGPSDDSGLKLCADPPWLRAWIESAYVSGWWCKSISGTAFVHGRHAVEALENDIHYRVPRDPDDTATIDYARNVTEEALAETISNIRFKGFSVREVIEGVKFPVTNGYGVGNRGHRVRRNHPHCLCFTADTLDKAAVVGGSHDP